MRFIVAKAAAASLLLSSLQSGALASTCPENLDSSVEIDKASSSILHYSIVAPESGSPGVLCARLESGIEGWYASSFLRSNQQTSYLLYQFRLPPRIGVGFTDTGKMNNNGWGWAVIRRHRRSGRFGQEVQGQRIRQAAGDGRAQADSGGHVARAVRRKDRDDVHEAPRRGGRAGDQHDGPEQGHPCGSVWQQQPSLPHGT